MREFPSLINSIVSMLSSNSTWALYKNFITNSTVSLLTAFHYQDRHNRERVVEFIGSSLHCLSSSCWELLFYVGDMVSEIHTYLLLTLLQTSLWSSGTYHGMCNSWVLACRVTLANYAHQTTVRCQTWVIGGQPVKHMVSWHCQIQSVSVACFICSYFCSRRGELSR